MRFFILLVLLALAASARAFMGSPLAYTRGAARTGLHMAGGEVVELCTSGNTFKGEVLDSQLPVLVDFYANVSAAVLVLPVSRAYALNASRRLFVCKEQACQSQYHTCVGHQTHVLFV
jgi:hypothetical protein